MVPVGRLRVPRPQVHRQPAGRHHLQRPARRAPHLPAQVLPRQTPRQRIARLDRERIMQLAVRMVPVGRLRVPRPQVHRQPPARRQHPAPGRAHHNPRTTTAAKGPLHRRRADHPPRQPRPDRRPQVHDVRRMMRVPHQRQPAAVHRQPPAALHQPPPGQEPHAPRPLDAAAQHIKPPRVRRHPRHHPAKQRGQIHHLRRRDRVPRARHVGHRRLQVHQPHHPRGRRRRAAHRHRPGKC